MITTEERQLARIAYLNMICRESFFEWTKKKTVIIKRKKERNAKFTKIACYALRVFLFFYIKGIFLAANKNSHISKERQKRNYSIKKVLYR